MSELITRAGAHLPDKDMKKYDRKLKQHVVVNWNEKDYSLSRIRSGLQQKAGTWTASSEHIIPEFTPISNQGPLGSCVANAWCDMMEMLDGLDGNDKVEQLSRLFLYWTARYYTGDTDRDEGTYLRSAAHQLNKVGIIDEKWWPYEGRADVAFKSPELDLYTMASNNRLPGFYRPESLTPDTLLNELELAIRADHPFVFGTQVSTAFQAYQGGGHVWSPPGNNDLVVGSHAMICTGVGFDGNKRYWLLRNSWGLHWGDSGHIKVSDEYVLEFRDIWIGTKMAEMV